MLYFFLGTVTYEVTFYSQKMKLLCRHRILHSVTHFGSVAYSSLSPDLLDEGGTVAKALRRNAHHILKRALRNRGWGVTPRGDSARLWSCGRSWARSCLGERKRVGGGDPTVAAAASREASASCSGAMG